MPQDETDKKLLYKFTGKMDQLHGIVYYSFDLSVVQCIKLY